MLKRTILFQFKIDIHIRNNNNNERTECEPSQLVAAEGRIGAQQGEN